MMFVVMKNLVVILESRVSRENREQHPRAHKRYVISCTCRGHRDGFQHCLHTRAFLEDSISPDQWKWIKAEQMKAPDKPEQSHNVGLPTEKEIDAVKRVSKIGDGQLNQGSTRK